MEQDTLLNDALNLLSKANDLEEQYERKGKTEESLLIQASSTYFEAVFLLKRHLNRLPVEPSSPRSLEASRTRKLLKEKIRHYEGVAADLLSHLGSGSAGGDQSPHRKSIHGVHVDAPTHCSSLSASAAPFQSDDIAEKVSLANIILATALDHDENSRYDDACESYLKAGESYLEAIKMSEESSQKVDAVKIGSIKRKLEGIMDRIEQLNKGQHKGQHERVSLKALPTQPLSPEEISVLKSSSLITSGLFLPWSEEEALAIDTSSAMRPFVDPDGLMKLSKRQITKFHRWARPREIMAMQGQSKAASIDMIRKIEPYRIKQHLVQDCSFIGSLCICAEYERRFKRRLVTSIIYPQDANGQPIINPSGKYLVKLWLNGIPRRVIIDDMFAVDRYGNLLCSHTQVKSGLELWVSIVEKAFMKLSGGYDFPGSNSGFDMYALTGWLPERIFFPEDQLNVRDFETPTERAYDRLHSASTYGDCLITASMSKGVSESEAERVGLVTGHAYAVLASVRTQNGTRLLRLKNPWAHSGWNGRFSKNDAISWSDPSLRAEVGYSPAAHTQYDDGVFFIAWDDVCRYFRNIHFSWNPNLFAYRTTLHASWPAGVGADDDSFNIRDNPQYILTLSEQAVQKGATVWVHVARHVTKQEQEGADVSDFLTLHIHRNDRRKEKIRYPGGSACTYTGAYTNSSHVLIRYDAIGLQDKFLSLVLSQYQKSNDLSYTLSCYCTAPFELGKPTKDPEHITELNSQWTSQSAGGPPSSSAFKKNPMWAIHVPPGIIGSSQDGSFLQMSCTTAKTVAVNLMLVPVDRLGTRIERLSTADPLIDTGDYRHSFVATDLNFVPSGSYTLVISSYYPGQTGTFALKLLSTSKIEVTRIA
mmetsp:Transcript_22585/g.64983  ORF Transcript_22585/g.64983 Transcript_22585/m.64983 type:complete len:875 (-) Transcript_22585:4571-7195(-)